MSSSDTLTCAVCGRSVHSDDAHRMVRLNHQQATDAAATQENYALHDRCQQAVFAGWRSS